MVVHSVPYSPGLDGTISPMLESQYVYLLKLYSKRDRHIPQSFVSCRELATVSGMTMEP